MKPSHLTSIHDRLYTKSLLCRQGLEDDRDLKSAMEFLTNAAGTIDRFEPDSEDLHMKESGGRIAATH